MRVAHLTMTRSGHGRGDAADGGAARSTRYSILSSVAAPQLGVALSDQFVTVY
jgi:hypothetical protein